MANILSLDQASHCSGYTVWSDGKPIKVSHFNAKGSTLAQRLVSIKQQVLKLIEEYKINQVVFEGIQMQQQNVKTFQMLAEVYGVLELTFTEMKIPYETVAPVVWKAGIKVAGKGRIKEKALTQKWVKDTYGLNCTEDEADSVGIGAYVVKQQDCYDWS